jgi:DNA-binding response OmpR family regulator
MVTLRDQETAMADRLRVFIVDEQPDVAALLSDALGDLFQRDHCEVVPCQDARRIVERAAAAQPALIMLNAHVERATAWSILAALRTNAATAHLPVLVYSTVRSDHEDWLVWLQLCRGDCVYIPFNLDELQKRVHHLLRRSAAPARRVGQVALALADADAPGEPDESAEWCGPSDRETLEDREPALV